MSGIIPQIVTNAYTPNAGGIPAGGGGGTDLNETDLNETVLNAAMRLIWEQSQGKVDTIVVGGTMKRRINSFLSAVRNVPASESRYRDLVSIYESDYGVCRILLSRWMPPDTLLMLDSSRIEVVPLQSRSFAYKPLASNGDRETGQIIGEYTLEFRNENAHGLLRGLT
jgi:hypothetical protein